jgi:hypothetical protein
VIEKLIQVVFPRQPLSDFSVDSTTLNYAKRLARIAPPQVDSEAGEAQEQMFATTEPGKYYGHGDFIQREA